MDDLPFQVGLPDVAVMITGEESPLATTVDGSRCSICDHENLRDYPDSFNCAAHVYPTIACSVDRSGFAWGLEVERGKE